MTRPVELGYWNVRGRGEKLRHLLEYCGVEYTQVVYQLSKKDLERWVHVDKPKLIGQNPAVTLPYLIDGDRLIS